MSVIAASRGFSQRWPGLSPPPATVPEAVTPATPAPAPCLAQSSLASLSLAPLAVPCLLRRCSLPMSLPSTHTPLFLTPPCLEATCPEPAGCPAPGALSPCLGWGSHRRKHCGWLRRVGPRDLIRGSRAPHPHTCSSSSPSSSLLQSRGARGRLLFWGRGPGPGTPHKPGALGPSQAG